MNSSSSNSSNAVKGNSGNGVSSWLKKIPHSPLKDTVSASSGIENGRSPSSSFSDSEKIDFIKRIRQLEEEQRLEVEHKHAFQNMYQKQFDILEQEKKTVEEVLQKTKEENLKLLETINKLKNDQSSNLVSVVNGSNVTRQQEQYYDRESNEKIKRLENTLKEFQIMRSESDSNNSEKISQLEKNLFELQSKLNDQNSLLESHETDKRTLVEARCNLENEYNRLKLHSEEQNDRVKRLEEQLVHEQQRTQELEHSFEEKRVSDAKQIEGLLEEKKLQELQATSNLMQLKREMEALTQTLEQQREEHISEVGKASDLHQQKILQIHEEYEQQRLQLSNRLSQVESELGVEKSKVQSLQTEIDQIKEQLNDERSSKQIIDKEKQQEQQKVKVLKNAVTKLVKELEEVVTQIEE